MKPTQPKITLQTLADQLGTSTATISRALKNDRAINSKTRARVMATAARLGYDRPSRGLPRTREHPRLLLLMPPHLKVSNTLILPIYLRGITTASTALNCSLIIEEITDANYGAITRRSKLPLAIRRDQADAVLFTGRHHPGDVAYIAQHLPAVSIQWDYEGTSVDLVTAFNARGIMELVRGLVSLGHERMAWVGASYESSFLLERQAGFIQGCLQGNVFPKPQHFFTIEQVNAALVKRVLREKVSALVCANDDVAQQVARACNAAGVSIPRDVSLTGFDGSQRELPGGGTLTSYNPVLSEVGQAAVQVAVQRIKEQGAGRMIQSRGGYALEGDSVLNRKKVA